MGIVLLQEMIPVKSGKIGKKIIDPPCFFKNLKKYEKKYFYSFFWPILVKLLVYFRFLVKLLHYRAQIAQNPLGGGAFPAFPHPRRGCNKI